MRAHSWSLTNLRKIHSKTSFEFWQEGGFGLFPVYPTSALARRAVTAARYRQQRVVIPSWYKVMFYLQIFQPELLQAQLWSVFSGRQSVAKSAAQTLGGGLKVPTQGDAKSWDTKKEE